MLCLWYFHSGLWSNSLLSQGATSKIASEFKSRRFAAFLISLVFHCYIISVLCALKQLKTYRTSESDCSITGLIFESGCCNSLFWLDFISSFFCFTEKYLNYCYSLPEPPLRSIVSWTWYFASGCCLHRFSYWFADSALSTRPFRRFRVTLLITSRIFWNLLILEKRGWCTLPCMEFPFRLVNCTNPFAARTSSDHGFIPSLHCRKTSSELLCQYRLLILRYDRTWRFLLCYGC